VGSLLLLRHLAGEPTVTRDAHRLYRTLGRLVASHLAPALARAADLAEAASYALVTLPRPVAPPRSQPIGTAVLFAVAALGLALLLL
jgi:hypothetical protein